MSETDNTDKEMARLGGVKGLLKAKNYEKGVAEGQVAFLKKKVYALNNEHIEMLFRMIKYDKEKVMAELIEYLEKHNIMVNILSSLVGEFSIVGTYTNKKGESKPAHFTKHGTFLKMIKKPEDEAPYEYHGYFGFRDYKEHFMKMMSTEGGLEPKNLNELFGISFSD
jgi:hypothetical protein